MTLNRTAFIAILSGIGVLFLIAYSFIYPHDKIVYIDSNKLLGGYKGMIEARKNYEIKHSAWQSNVDTLTKSVQDAIKKYSRDLALGSAKEKEISKQQIQDKQKELMDYQNAVKQNAAAEEGRLNQNVFNVINAYLEKFGKRSSYKMILIAANGNVGFADPSLDITETVVEGLNREYSGQTK